jgi:hypothetical protein
MIEIFSLKMLYLTYKQKTKDKKHIKQKIKKNLAESIYL